MARQFKPSPATSRQLRREELIEESKQRTITTLEDFEKRLGQAGSPEEYEKIYNNIDTKYKKYFLEPNKVRDNLKKSAEDARVKVREEIEKTKSSLERKKENYRETCDKYKKRYSGEKLDKKLQDLEFDYREDMAYSEGLLKGFEEGLSKISDNAPITYNSIYSYAKDIARYERDRQQARNEKKEFRDAQPDLPTANVSEGVYEMIKDNPELAEKYNFVVWDGKDIDKKLFDAPSPIAQFESQFPSEKIIRDPKTGETLGVESGYFQQSMSLEDYNRRLKEIEDKKAQPEKTFKIDRKITPISEDLDLSTSVDRRVLEQFGTRDISKDTIFPKTFMTDDPRGAIPQIGLYSNTGSRSYKPEELVLKTNLSFTDKMDAFISSAPRYMGDITGTNVPMVDPEKSFRRRLFVSTIPGAGAIFSEGMRYSSILEDEKDRIKFKKYNEIVDSLNQMGRDYSYGLMDYDSYEKYFNKVVESEEYKKLEKDLNIALGKKTYEQFITEKLKNKPFLKLAAGGTIAAIKYLPYAIPQYLLATGATGLTAGAYKSLRGSFSLDKMKMKEGMKEMALSSLLVLGADPKIRKGIQSFISKGSKKTKVLAGAGGLTLVGGLSATEAIRATKKTGDLFYGIGAGVGTAIGLLGPAGFNLLRQKKLTKEVNKAIKDFQEKGIIKEFSGVRKLTANTIEITTRGVKVGSGFVQESNSIIVMTSKGKFVRGKVFVSLMDKNGQVIMQKVFPILDIKLKQNLPTRWVSPRTSTTPRIVQPTELKATIGNVLYMVDGKPQISSFKNLLIMNTKDFSISFLDSSKQIEKYQYEDDGNIFTEFKPSGMSSSNNILFSKYSGQPPSTANIEKYISNLAKVRGSKTTFSKPWDMDATKMLKITYPKSTDISKTSSILITEKPTPQKVVTGHELSGISQLSFPIKPNAPSFSPSLYAFGGPLGATATVVSDAPSGPLSLNLLTPPWGKPSPISEKTTFNLDINSISPMKDFSIKSDLKHSVKPTADIKPVFALEKDIFKNVGFIGKPAYKVAQSQRLRQAQKLAQQQKSKTIQKTKLVQQNLLVSPSPPTPIPPTIISPTPPPLIFGFPEFEFNKKTGQRRKVRKKKVTESEDLFALPTLFQSQLARERKARRKEGVTGFELFR